MGFNFTLIIVAVRGTAQKDILIGAVRRTAPIKNSFVQFAEFTPPKPLFCSQVPITFSIGFELVFFADV